MFVLGLRNIASKSAQDVLSTFNQILCDIEDQAEEMQNNTAKIIMAKVSSMMSDCAATHISSSTNSW